MKDLKGINKKTLAKAIGVSYSTIYRWIEKGILEEKLEALEREVELLKTFEELRKFKEKGEKNEGKN